MIIMVMIIMIAKKRVLKESVVRNVWEKLYKSGAFIEACNDNFFNEIIEYDITNEKPARLLKK